jgi:hypothetical protein
VIKICVNDKCQNFSPGTTTIPITPCPGAHVMWIGLCSGGITAIMHNFWYAGVLVGTPGSSCCVDVRSVQLTTNTYQIEFRPATFPCPPC